MAIPKFKKEYVMDALKYIDENGVPFHNQSTKYELVTDDGKRYPPKYVVAVADYLANGTNISTDGFNAVEAKSFLEGQGFTIETKQQEKFELSITAESVVSTDERFTMDNISLGDNYKPLDVSFKKATGVREEIPIRPCLASPARFLKSRLHLCLLRIRRVFLYANTTRTVR